MADPIPEGSLPPPPRDGLTVDVLEDIVDGAVGLAWTVGPGTAARWGAEPTMAIAGYDVWICLGEQCIPWNHNGRLWTTPGLKLPTDIVGQSVPVTLELRVVVEWVDGTRSEAISCPFTVAPVHQLLTTDEWEVDAAELLVDDQTRNAAGLRYWPDGSIGFARIRGETYGFASNGPSCSRWRIDPGQFLGELLQVSEPIRGVHSDIDYASGSSVWVDPTSGTMLLFYHEEVHPGGDELRFWSAIGLAFSDDEGATFTSLGRIISPNIGVDDPNRAVLTEIGGAPCIVHDGMFLIYFRETLATGGALNMSVARASVADVLAAGLDGRLVPWHKFRDGRWDEPGVGGAASDLFADSPVTRWFDVVRQVDHDRLVMIGSDGLADEWAYTVRTSADGIAWTDARQIGETERGGELLYLSVAATDLSEPKQARGDELHLYRTRSAKSGSARWDDAVVERLTLRHLSPAEPA